MDLVGQGMGETQSSPLQIDMDDWYSFTFALFFKTIFISEVFKILVARIIII